ncbi:two-component system, HptB-dependent secretion and biofilm response regulator [Gammaproteobacteria bacterium]
MPTILVANRSEPERNMVVDFLNGLDYRTFGFQNGNEILAYCRETATPDLIILDANLQNFDVCREIHGTPWGKQLPVIIITGIEQDFEIEDAFVAGVDEFLSKPLNWVVIRQRIRVLLERTQAQQAQQEVEQLFRSVFDTAVDAIIIINSEGIIQSLNHATTQMFGYSKEELVGRTVNRLMPEPWSSEHDHYLQNYLQTGRAQIIGIGREVTARHRNGQLFPARLAVSQLPIGSGKKILFTGILHDVSQRVRIENQLRQQNDRMEEERQIIQDILRRMHRAAPYEGAGLRLLEKPVEETSGDLLLSSSRPNGSKHIFLGDFTGHGLSAALVGPLVTDIFYTMTKKGFAPDQILSEINRQLHNKLPASLFLAGCFLELDPVHQRLLVWNGAFPEVKIMRQGAIFARIPSHTLPLGILTPTQFDPNGITLDLKKDDHVIVFTDGIIETRSPTEEMFGDARLEKLLEEILTEDRTLEEIISRLTTFRGDMPQEDDITLAVLSLTSAPPQ